MTPDKLKHADAVALAVTALIEQRADAPDVAMVGLVQAMAALIRIGSKPERHRDMHMATVALLADALSLVPTQAAKPVRH